jgi:hypothetical protein
LFDNANDPYQIKDLAQDPAHQANKNKLKDKMQTKMASLSDTFAQSTYYRDHWTDGNRNILRDARG